MKAAALSFVLSLAFLAAHNTAWARDAVLPAGTLVQCTLDEPNFSSATVSVGDPVLCYPHGLYFFGQIVFPRGTYIVGHLADDKEPGHFWGKGDLHLEFDRIGLPSADVPFSAKIIAVSGGYRVDKEGKIIGKGHAKRDTVEWLFPPLWPWKIITLPARGPRPVLKGETRVTLRLMDDVLVPDAGSYRHFGRLDSGESYAHPALYLRPQQKLTVPSGLTEPVYRSISWQQSPATAPQPDSDTATAPANDDAGWHKFGRSAYSAHASAPQAPPADPANIAPASPANIAPADDSSVAVTPAADDTPTPGQSAVSVDDLPASAPAADVVAVPASSAVPAIAAAPAANPAPTADAPGLAKNSDASAASGAQAPKPRLTLFAVQAGTVYAVTDYWRDEDRLGYVLANGKEGQLDLSQLDWKLTTQLNAERNVKVTLRDGR